MGQYSTVYCLRPTVDSIAWIKAGGYFICPLDCVENTENTINNKTFRLNLNSFHYNYGNNKTKIISYIHNNWLNLIFFKSQPWVTVIKRGWLSSWYYAKKLTRRYCSIMFYLLLQHYEVAVQSSNPDLLNYRVEPILA